MTNSKLHSENSDKTQPKNSDKRVSEKRKKALLFVNIGTPENLDLPSVKKYLKKFLMDKYVIDIPFPIRWFLVNAIIVPFRSPKSLEAYRAIWKKEGSPLEIYTKELVDEAAQKFKKEFKGEWLVDYAMSYSKPLIQEKLEELKQQGVKDFYCLPMYPQYAESTSRSVLEELKKWFKKQKEDLKLKSLEFYFNAPSFLEASEKKIQSSLAEVPGTAEHFKDAFYLFSYHGLPERHVKKLYPNHCKNNNSCCTNWSEDNRFCYRAQCLQTTERLAEKLDLKQYALSFQSRLGKQEWLRPYTVDKVKELAEAGVKNLFVIPYAFTIDCLETEEEIEEEIKEAFLEAGGESFYRVPCLNKDFAEVLTEDFLNNFTEVTS